MGFLAPLALFGLVAALVPPLLHLFQRRQPPQLEFPAVRYLQQTEREAERRIRLRHLLLMLLRVAAVVLIVLAAARPVVPGGVGGLHEPTAVAIVLDNSLSSGAVAGGERVFDALAARARETLREARTGDAVWLLGADGIARRGTAAELLAVVDAMQPDARRLALPAAVRTAARLVAGSGYARVEIHVLSDMQESALEEGTEGTEGVPVLVYHPAADPPVNLGVAEARPQPSLWLPGTGAVAARIAGGPSQGYAAQASLLLGDRVGARALARSGETVTLGAPRAEPGWRTGVVELVPDELRADDRRPYAVRVVSPATVAAGLPAVLGPFVASALAVLEDAGRLRPDPRGDVAFGTTLDRRAVASVLVPPADAVQLGAVNRALATAGVPWRYGARVEREDTLAAPLVPELAGGRVRVRLRLEPGSGAQRGGEVLAHAGGDPWLVRHERVVLVGSRLVPEETSLPLGGGFVSFLDALLNRVARGEAGVLDAAPGDAVPLPSRATGVGLGGDSVQTVDGGAVIVAPAHAGAYPVLGGRDTLAMLVVGSDPRESDLRRARAPEVRRALPGMSVAVTDDPLAYAARRFRGAGRSELTGWFLALALGVLVAEGLLAAGGLRRAMRES